VSRPPRLALAGVLAALLLLGLLAGMASPGFPVAGLPAAFGRTVAGAFGGAAPARPAPLPLPPGPDVGASDAALADVPSAYLGLYVAAARTCPALSWQVLAGIGKVESDHGRSPAPGVRTGVNAAGCCAGPMQFNVRNGPPSTWASFGRGDVYDPADAIPAAARKLCADGLATPTTRSDPCPQVLGSPALHTALLAYNHACWYAHQVVTIAARYTRGAPTPPPSADPFVVALARNPNLTATTSHGCDPAPDLASGRLDLRVQSLLAVIAEHWRVRLSCAYTGHSVYVKGTTRVSNHHAWRAVDIDLVDGQPVSPRSSAARSLVGWLDRLQGPLRPAEVGSPFPIGHRPYFTDEGHQEHIHIGYGAEA
jgi:hypothetical protein